MDGRGQPEKSAETFGGEGNPLLWNLMWPNAGLPDGSFYFDNPTNMLDQFLVKQEHGHRRRRDQGQPRQGANPQTASHDRPRSLPKPIPYGGMRDPVNQNGFSDHFPITMTVTEDE